MDDKTVKTATSNEKTPLLSGIMRESSESIGDKESSSDGPTLLAELLADSKSRTVVESPTTMYRVSDLSANAATVNLLKVVLGTGIMALPKAFQNAGLWFGFFGLIAICGAVSHAMFLLVQCTQHLRRHYAAAGMPHVALDYEDTVVKCFEFGPRLFQRVAKPAGFLINVFVMVTQIGLCAVYIMFISESIKLTVEALCGDFCVLELVHHKLMLSVVLLPLVFIPTLRKLSWLSALGNLCAVVGLFLTIAYCVQDLHDISEFKPIKGFDTLALFFGTAVFSFEAANLVLPIENRMRHPEEMRHCTGVIMVVSCTALALYCAVGFLGYLKFGESVAASITFSLPTTPWYWLMVKPLYALSITVSFLLQYYLFHQMTVNSVARLLYREAASNIFLTSTLRLVCLAFVAFLAIMVPQLDLVISLIGSWAGACITLIFPSICHTLLFWNRRTEVYCFAIIVIKNLLLAALGLIGLITGTFSSLRELYYAFDLN